MKSKRRISILPALGLVFATIFFCRCSNTDCPLNNTVSLRADFYQSSTGTITNVTDTFSVIAVGRRDTTVLNRYHNFSQIKLPMGYVQTTDTLLFRFLTDAGVATDSVFISHTNKPHFVSLDCSTAFFHTITDVRITRRAPSADFPTAIDSIVIANPEVNYDEKQNLQIYFSNY